MQETPNWKNIRLNKQCGVCINYKPKIIDGVLTARGNCRLTNVYKQRHEKCMKFEEENK